MLGSVGSTRSHTAPAVATTPTLSLVFQTAELTFTADNYSTAQTAQIALSSAPANDVTVKLEEDGVTFNPSTLTFTTVNWSVTQNVR